MIKGNLHYVYNIGKDCVVTDSYKTSISLTVVRESTEEIDKKVIGFSDIFLIKFTNDNFYMNAPQEFGDISSQEVDDMVQFKRCTDLRSIEFNSWWQIDVIEEPDIVII